MALRPNNSFTLNGLTIQFPIIGLGHACVAFSWATVLAEEFKEEPVIGIVSYSLAAGTAFARIYKNKHWISDVFVGGLLSHLIAKKIVALHAGHDGRSVSIQPTLSGIVITFHL